VVSVAGRIYPDPGGYQTQAGMTFSVTGLSVSGPTLIGCDSDIEALEKAAELIRAGFAKVLIADSHGVRYTPCEFVRLFRL
jgi:hypothetical protein